MQFNNLRARYWGVLLLISEKSKIIISSDINDETKSN